MVGWNNPMPIGKAHWTGLGARVRLQGMAKKVYLVAGTVRGHSSEAIGPWTP